MMNEDKFKKLLVILAILFATELVKYGGPYESVLEIIFELFFALIAVGFLFFILYFVFEEVEITKIMFDIICLALVIFAVMILNTGNSLLDVLALFVGKASQISYGIVS